MKKIFKLALVAFAAALAFAACQKPVTPQSETIALKGIALNKPAAELEIGATETLTVTYDPSNATEKPEVEWSSSAPAVATVDKGVVTAVAAGEATITAKAGTFTATCKITVKAGEEPTPEIIAIDGDFSDWAEIEPVTVGNHTVKYAKDEKFVYIYSQRAKDEQFDALWGSDEGYVYFALDLDKNLETGDQTLWGNGPYEYVGVIWPYGGTADAPVVNKTPKSAATTTGSAISGLKCDGKIDADGVAIEFAIPVSAFPAFPETPYILYSWGSTGLAKVEYHVGEPQPEPEAIIKIDGDMSDWADVEDSVTSEKDTPVYAEFKVTNDEKYMYFYSKRDVADAIWNKGGYIYYDIDADNDATTGTSKEIDGLEMWVYYFPFAGSSSNHEIATSASGGESESGILAALEFAGAIGEDYVEVEARLPLEVAKVTRGTTIAVYSWGNKSGDDLKKTPIIYEVK